VTQCYQTESGAFSDRPGGSWDLPLSAIGAMAAAELQAPVKLNRTVRYLSEGGRSRTPQ